jgi:chemotaxis protein MotB
MNSNYIIFLLLIATITQSCVSLNKYRELDDKYAISSQTLDSLKYMNNEISIVNDELSENVLRLTRRKGGLEQDTLELGMAIRKKQRAYNDLSTSYEGLIQNNSSTMAKQAEKNRALLEQLGEMDLDLQERERLLVQREKDLKQLRSKLNQKDKDLEQLKTMVSSALLSFQGEGLSVNHRDGKLYVSLENSLLFSSGSWAVNDKGVKAITKLSSVLTQQPGLQIMVEGHTDNIPFKGAGLIKDNWDLSVMRATAIVRIMANNKGIKLENITASGKGDTKPLVPNNSSENRAVNRRTEIILSPNIDDLLDLLD